MAGPRDATAAVRSPAFIARVGQREAENVSAMSPVCTIPVGDLGPSTSDLGNTGGCLPASDSRGRFERPSRTPKVRGLRSEVRGPRSDRLLRRRNGQGCCTYTIVVIMSKCTMTYIYLRTLLPRIPILGQKKYPFAPGEAEKPVRSIFKMPIAGPTMARRATRTTRPPPPHTDAPKTRQNAFKRVFTKNQQLPPTFNDLHQLSTT